MKRKKSNTTDLRSFLQRAAAKKHSQDKVEQEVEGGIPSTNQSCMQLVVFEGQTDGSGPSIISPEPEAVRVEAEPTVVEDDEVISLNETDCSDEEIRMLRVAQAEYMIEALKLGEIETEQGLNQEMGLARPGDT